MALVVWTSGGSKLKKGPEDIMYPYLTTRLLYGKRRLIEKNSETSRGGCPTAPLLWIGHWFEHSPCYKKFVRMMHVGLRLKNQQVVMKLTTCSTYCSATWRRWRAPVCRNLASIASCSRTVSSIGLLSSCTKYTPLHRGGSTASLLHASVHDAGARFTGLTLLYFCT